MPIELALALVRLAEKALDFLMLVIQDQPKEERIKAWQRWFKFWDPVWKAVGLDVTQPPL